jgi:hypothetical protein
MTEKDRAELRLACLRMFVEAGSKVELSTETIFMQAGRAWEFVTAAPDALEGKRGQARASKP